MSKQMTSSEAMPLTHELYGRQDRANREGSSWWKLEGSGITAPDKTAERSVAIEVSPTGASHECTTDGDRSPG